MKNILALFLLAGAGLTVSAQEPAATPKPVTPPPAAAAETKEPVSKIDEPMARCDLGLKHSPIVDGTMQLGMPETEAALKFGATFEPDPATQGGKRVSTKLDRNPIFEKVESGSITTVGEKVTSIRLNYTTKYPNVKEFIQYIAPRLGVVRIGFRVDNERNEAKMVCKEFTVDLKTTDSGSEVLLIDTTGSRKAELSK